MRRVDIIVFEGVDEIDALGPLEVFRSAARLAGELFETRLVSRTSDLRVQGAFGLRFEADCPWLRAECSRTWPAQLVDASVILLDD